MKTKAQKQKDLEALTEQFKNAKAAMLVGFEKLTVSKDQELRNQLRGPGYQSYDMTLQRLIKFGGRYTATLRWDVFNLFNTTNFGLPNRNVSDATTIGTITSLSGDPRIMQLAFRFGF